MTTTLLRVVIILAAVFILPTAARSGEAALARDPDDRHGIAWWYLLRLWRRTGETTHAQA